MRSALAVALLALALALAACGGEGGPSSSPTTEPPTTTEPPPEPHPEPEPAPPEPAPPPSLPPPDVAMSWSSAGAFVWHEEDVSPEALGAELRSAGFGWLALRVHDGLVEDPIVADWVARFRRASGLPVGGWGVLREDPVREAALADALIARHGLDFYVANAELEYGYTASDGQSPRRFERSRSFVSAFRRLRPALPAGLSSYCRPDRHDLDWGAWADSGFVFLPQAYVNDFGPGASPVACARAARPVFGDSVHPTIGSYDGALGAPSPERYARLLGQAGTVGFSVYLAETGMTEDEWSVLGEAIVVAGIARLPRPV
ncbi:MAG: hypothetical protein R6W48_11105 [Gaiellaceae bacterium]